MIAVGFFSRDRPDAGRSCPTTRGALLIDGRGLSFGNNNNREMEPEDEESFKPGPADAHSPPPPPQGFVLMSHSPFA